MEFADLLHEKMEQQDISQASLMRATGASKGTVSLWVNGISTPGSRYLMPLSAALGVSVEAIARSIENKAESDSVHSIENAKRANRISEALNMLADKGVSQNELSKVLNISPQAISKWKRSGQLSREAAQALAELSGVNFEWLATGKCSETTQAQSVSFPINSEHIELLYLFDKSSPEVKAAILKALKPE